MQQENLKKYAKLAIQTGINIQKGQALLINCPIEGAEFAHLLVEEAYNAGAEDVRVEWNDEVLTRMKYEREPMRVLENFPDWKVQMYNSHAEKGGAVLSVYSPNPELLKGVDPKRVAAANKASGEALKQYRSYMMNDRVQWSLVSIPTKTWAAKIFPDCLPDEAVEKLWEQIFHITRIDQDDPIETWKKHNETLRQAREILNQKQYKTLVYKAPGTNLEIELPENHIWCGGSSVTEKGVEFNPNIPTEEVYTAPHKDGVNGTVTNTKPLNYNGNIIDHFSLTFKDGIVVDFQAEEGYETLKHLLETDEGAKRLGEVALVPDNSPISASGLVFYNTLYDENASCHLALGEAYPTTVEGCANLSEDELKERGLNVSIIHEDFMMGSAELDIDGITKDGKAEPIMRKGNWALDME